MFCSSDTWAFTKKNLSYETIAFHGKISLKHTNEKYVLDIAVSSAIWKLFCDFVLIETIAKYKKQGKFQLPKEVLNLELKT